MASTLDNSSKPWWSMKANSAPGPEYASEKPKLKSKSLNSLFGRKFKKQSPSLAIPDPPLPMQSIPPEETQSFTSRPPSKSVSSTRSRPDSLEPRTPSDFHHNSHRHSLLTLSDTDPFASPRNISIVSSPHLPSDPTRLSAYSNASSSGAAEQPYTKNNEGQPRTSYASSSYSHQAGSSESPVPSVLAPTLPPTRKLLMKRSDGALNGNKGQLPSPQHAAISGTASGAMGSNVPSSRPLTRPRGLTDNGATQKSGFFVDRLQPTISGSYSTNPVTSEQSSSSRPPSSRRPSNASSTRSPPSGTWLSIQLCWPWA
ncbi:hypothetical protein NMY22_g4344 [Coprinellus aureogranulatus]|nr:hypothetical protein NMY22_g4344 [Coprinellus aureogranulatus]